MSESTPHETRLSSEIGTEAFPCIDSDAQPRNLGQLVCQIFDFGGDWTHEEHCERIKQFIEVEHAK